MSTNPKPVYLKDYTPPAFEISDTHLTFDLDPSQTEVRVQYTLKHQQGVWGEPLYLKGDALLLKQVKIDEKVLSSSEYEVSSQHLTIYSVPAQCIVSITTLISPSNNKELMGLYASSGNFCTQCEAEGFRRITYSFDRPDVLSIFTTKIIANANDYPTLLSNGNLIEEGQFDQDRHYAIWHDPFPKPTYLFALVAGRFDCLTGDFTTQSGRNVDIQIYTDPGQANQCAHALNAVKKSMKWDEERYGLEYDLDLFMIVAVNDFNFGAMENKGLNIFNAKYILADNQSATDSDFTGVESVVAHEYFHNWSGNRVTLRDWFQLSLKEGLTVYRDQSFDEDQISKVVHRVNLVNRLRSYQFKEDQSPMAHPVQPQSYLKIDNFYTTTIYAKGAEVIRMFNLLLGDENYRKACDSYFSSFDGQAVTIQDFAQKMQDHSDLDLSSFLLWYTQAGTPELTIQDHYDPDAQTYTLTVNQKVPDTAGQKNKSPMLIPIKLGLIDQDGHEVDTPKLYRGELFLVDQEEQSIVFNQIKSPVVPSLLRQFSAPVNLKYTYTNEQLIHLLKYDTDGFCRWEASQNLALYQIMPLVD
jgi:aminopeptidase N